jgi:hypothetical protein
MCNIVKTDTWDIVHARNSGDITRRSLKKGRCWIKGEKARDSTRDLPVR